jgi:TPP-dependent trihydroxycyclohexane-1,2-dione (THcHDO) dehydratase
MVEQGLLRGDASEAKNRIAAATSSARPGRFSIVTCAALALYCSTVSPEAAMRR